MNSSKEKGVIKRNAELKQQLAANARKLKIEAGLEKVRAVALKMKKPADMLEVCKTISLQLQKLGVNEIRNVQTAIFYESKGTYMNYEYYAKHKKTIITETIYTNHKVAKAFAAKMLSGKGEVYITHIKGKKVKDWIAYQKTTNVFIDRFLEKANSLSYYWHSLGPVALGISTYDPLSEDELNLFQRFVKVFELAYKRYLDIELAMAQAREAQIQLALERVRARTMAMHNSDELTDVVKMLYQEFDKLKLSNESTDIEIGLINEETGIASFWAHLYLSDGTISTFKIPLARFEGTKNEYKQWRNTPVEKRNEIFITTEFSGKRWDKIIKNAGQLPELAEFFKSLVEANISKWVTHNAYFSHGLLTLQGTEVYSPETQEILKRFAKVFEQTYTRFLDLQKAEAQAKEARIEAALEKVRSRSLAMHKSEELQEVVTTVFERLQELDIQIDAINLDVFNENKKDAYLWTAVPGHKYSKEIHIPYNEVTIFKDIYDGMISGKEIHSKVYSRELKDEFLNYVFEHTDFRYIPEERKKMLFAADGSTVSVAYAKNTAIIAQRYRKDAFSDDDNEILKRFARVFEQAYTRFLDLQKAEAQAREAQIEAALERVRAGSLAMHHSDDLISVINVVKEQLVQLGFHFHGANFVTDYSDKGYTMWLAAPNESFPTKIYVPQLQQKLFKGVADAVEKGLDFATYTLSFDEKNIYFKNLFENSLASNTSEEGKKLIFESKGMAASVVLLKKIRLNLMNLDLKPYTDEENNILKRIAYVFEQSYIRFLDLQKAEAQAREAQIQLALERVRARTMAMQRSDELPQAATLLFQQVQSLGINLFSTGYNIWDENKRTVTSSMSSGGIIQPSFRLPLTEETSLIECYEAGQRGDIFFVQEIGEAKLRSHLSYMRTLPVIGELMNKIAEAGFPLPDYIINHHAFFSHGYLLFITYAPVPDAHEIFKRFAKVFEQTYTRFLDLQKAEAQAKEAQTEVALERIRARAMAMHSSNELMDVANILREQMGLLDQPDLETSVVNLFEEDSELIFSWNASRVPGSSEKIVSSITSFLKNSSELTREMMSLYHSKEKEYTLEAAGLKLMEFLKVLIDANPRVADYIGNNPPEQVFYHFTTFTGGNLLTVSYQPPSEETKSLQRRAASVFDMAYRRYLDLKKAEAQAREAQIEVALERVRAKVMAMSNSKDLNETSLVFGEQLRKLNIDWQFSYFWLIDEAKHDTTFWITWPDYKTSFSAYTMDEAAKYFNDCLVAWRGGVKIHDNYVPPEDVQAWLDTFQRIADDAGGEAKKIMMPQTFPNGVFYYDAMMKYGSFGICVSKRATDEEKKIQCRFAIEFERAYSRFLDLKQAEAQTREAKIEASLERVRAKAMAMHKSDDFNDAVAVVFDELEKLNLGMLRCGIGIFNKEKRSAEVWTTTVAEHGRTVQVCGDESMDLHPLLKGDFAAWLRQEDFSYVLEGEDMSEYYRAVMETNFKLPESQIMVEHPEQLKQLYYAAMFESGSMFAFRETDFPEEAKVVMKRFAGVFNLTYKRFLDLQKAEAQTRESQIELGLERVRARAMAMQNSDELKELIGTVNTELTKLDLILDRCFIMIYDNKSMGVTWWMSNPEAPLEPIGLFVKYHEQVPYQAFIQGWKERNLKWQYVLEGEVKKTWDKFLFVETELSQLPDFVIANMKANEKVYLSASFNNFGCLTLATLESLSDEHFDIMLRFAKVFDLTYTRFNDLKQAEAQAREAKIEAALERVRAKAMAMHKTEDLNPAVATVFEELDKLNIGILRCGIAIMDKEKPRGDVWITVKSEQSNTIQVSGDESLDYHPLLRGAYDGWLKQEDFSYVLQGEDLISYYHDVASMQYQLPVSTSFDKEKKDQQQYYYNAVFQDGSLFAFMETAITDEAQTVIKRFANVFNLTYKRFLDLQKAEAQTREAKIEAALERVRARALAMQDPEELKDVAQVLRTEMGLLGVEELETCSIYINDEATNKTECWYALKDPRAEEKKLVSDHFPLNLNDTWVGREMKIFYGSNAKQVSIVMQGANRKEWINYCEERSVPFRGYYGEVIPDRTYHLYKFSHGAIGAAAAGDISPESWKLLSRAASVFSLAYSRFKDLTQARIDLIKLKEEKKRAEDALSDLQSAQKQLVQAEKMASLGELTAGIAHEIQNPLNFVNNFSDVSNELLEEMKAELEKGNAEEAKLIAVDVKENLEKILHHGKRADAIVKGMLQHSRANTGQKEPTDINVLAEEYLRLAYHGLRAKDKFFNAKFETDLDPSITKINIVPQEIGRVILNLINNSFYAVTEKKRTVSNGYEPSVTVSTKKLDDKVEIRIVDNGNGIPQKVLDKIFQPFFTTKPTGQGTGLGLSLSYDIVTKGHDGEIKVETKEGEGSAFTISLPMK